MNRGPYVLTQLAESGGRFASFVPYVASIDDRGTVAFQAALIDGGEGIFASRDGDIEAVFQAPGGPIASFISHPDIDCHGAVSVYANLKSGRQGVLLIRNCEVVSIAETGKLLLEIGPLGPTMADNGGVAFRATATTGATGLYFGDGADCYGVAISGDRYKGFQGLPVALADGSVAYRADLDDGESGIHLWCHGRYEIVIETGSGFKELGNFPSFDSDGHALFAAIRSNGESGVFLSKDGAIKPLIESKGRFESFRGALMSDSGNFVAFATPVGGSLGIYAGPSATKVLGVGDPLFGSTISEFALNPVSINRFGQMAIRVHLVDGRQYIFRADPNLP